MRLRASIVVVAFLLIPARTLLAEENVVELVASVGPNVVTLKTFDSNGRPLAQGSGFLLDDGRVVTNTHVVRGAANVELFDSAGQLIGTTQYAEVLSNTVDIAILPRTVTEQPGLALATDDPLVGTRIFAIGAPEGLQNTVSDGLVSAVREIDSQRVIQISAPVSSGSSGGPVVDIDGQVIGVSVMSLVDGQNLNFAVPARDIRVLAGSPPGQVDFGTIAATNFEGVPERGKPLPVGEEIHSDLHGGLPQLGDESFFESWYFEGEVGERYRITMASAVFDTFLILGRIEDDRFIQIEQNDDSGRKRNSQIDFVAPADGEYVIRANSFAANSIGAYTLEVRQR